MMKSSTTYLACALRRKITAFVLKKFVSISDLIVIHQLLWIFFLIYFFFLTNNNLLLIFNYFWSTDSETVRFPYEVSEFYSFCWFCKMGWDDCSYCVTYIGRTTCSFSTGCLHVPLKVHLWNRWNKKGLHFIFFKEGDECSSKSKNT